jgi:hypothetical protein
MTQIMTQQELVVFVANCFVGIREEPVNSNNVIFNTRFYGRTVSGSDYPWCLVFVWDVFRIAGLGRLLFDGRKIASCSALMDWARRGLTFVDGGFAPGDVMFFDFDKNRKDAEHTGIFVRMEGDLAVCVEGNTAVGNDSNGGQVMLRSRESKCIIGAHRPRWDVVVSEGSDMTQSEFGKMADQYFRDRAALPAPGWLVKEGSWDRASNAKAKASGVSVFNGSAPEGFITRGEAAAVLDRLGLFG